MTHLEDTTELLEKVLILAKYRLTPRELLVIKNLLRHWVDTEEFPKGEER